MRPNGYFVCLDFAQFLSMIVLKKLTASLIILSHRMYKYWTGQAVIMNPCSQDSSFYKNFTGGISVKVYGFSPKKERGQITVVSFI